MNVPAVLVDSGPRSAVSPVGVVKFKLGKEARIFARVEIKMGHHSVHDVAIVVLRTGAKHPVVKILVFDTIFESKRKGEAGIAVEPNVLSWVEKVRTLGRIRQETPILLSRKWIQRRPRPIWRRTRWVRIRRLRYHWQRRERDGKGDPQKKLLGAYSRHQTSLPRSRPWCLTSYLPYTFWAW